MTRSPKVFYVTEKTDPELIAEQDNFIRLIADNWDDFGYKTSFRTHCKVDGQEIELGRIRILVEDQTNSARFFDELGKTGKWNGAFPVPGLNYISTPDDVSFYEHLKSALGRSKTEKVARALRDASFMSKIADDEGALRLIGSDGFRLSLQRERGSQRAFVDGGRLISGESTDITSVAFHFLDARGKPATLDLDFDPNEVLPHEINVLVGPNGTGKSQILHKIVDTWLDDRASDRDSALGFDRSLNVGQLIVVSYSPFELFPVDSSDKQLAKQDVYKYFGLRGRANWLNPEKPPHLRLSREFPKFTSATSLLACAADDLRFGSIHEWSNKLNTIKKVLSEAIEFDYPALRLAEGVAPDALFAPAAFFEDPHLTVEEGGKSRIYIPIEPGRYERAELEKIDFHIDRLAGVVFFKDKKIVQLSSGQKLFSYIVINILGSIRRNSLILIDEPEIFLHPTLEIQLIEMLKTILKSYWSKALLATHSEVTVREIPAACVHVLDLTEEGLSITNPPFETFGGDVQRISSYVFGDKAISKPFEDWLEAKLREYKTAPKLIKALGKHVNEEMIVRIYALARREAEANGLV